MQDIEKNGEGDWYKLTCKQIMDKIEEISEEDEYDGERDDDDQSQKEEIDPS